MCVSHHQYIAITILLPGNVTLGRISTSTLKKIRYSFVALLSNIYFSCLISKLFSHQNQGGRKLTTYSFLVSFLIFHTFSPCQIYKLFSFTH